MAVAYWNTTVPPVTLQASYAATPCTRARVKRVWAEERAGRRVAGLVARLLCERLPALLAIYAPNAASPEVTTAAQLVQTSIVAVATRAPQLGQPTRATDTRPTK